MPLRDYKCSACEYTWEKLEDQEQKYPDCPKCLKVATGERQPALIGGYQGSFGGASTRPKYSGSFKRGKT